MIAEHPFILRGHAGPLFVETVTFLASLKTFWGFVDGVEDAKGEKRDAIGAVVLTILVTRFPVVFAILVDDQSNRFAFI